MNLSGIDLNLLVVFDAMIEAKSTTRAARRVNLSQPAISHALNRLRHQFQDELFVRGASGMQPTPRALEIAGPVRRALAEIQGVLDGGSFEPAHSRRRFAVAVQNYATIVMLPYLIDRMRAEAPGIDLRTHPGDPADALEGLEEGRMDLAVGHFDALPERFAFEELLTDDMVCVLRWDHPLAGENLTLDGYVAMPHLVVSVDGSDTDGIDPILARHGRQRRVALTVPHFVAASIVLARSDMVATVTRRVAEAFAHGQSLKILPPPFEVPIERFVMVWHRRLAIHPAQLWLRSLYRDAALWVRERRQGAAYQAPPPYTESA
jgi:DNA-binding transcriptional LysR family regulator